MKVRAFAAFQPGGKLEPFEYEAPTLGPHDVQVRVEFCGICHSDIHLIDNDWRNSRYPLVPGHEIVGVVEKRGALVDHLRIGQRVGIGWQRSSCLHCEWCLRGEENLCPRREATCVGHFGGFAQSVFLDSRFVFPVPEGLDPAQVAPLMCAGITVYSPLRHAWQGHPLRVGVVGLGGLGHLAVQFARALGAQVTVFSSHPEKKADALKLGAHRFVWSNDPGQLEKLAGALDLILSTVHLPLDWKGYVQCLRPRGTLCFLSGLAGVLNIPSGYLMNGHRSLKGSTVGNRWTMQEMLEVVKWNNIQPWIELFPGEKINEAVQKVRQNRIRYRAVLDFRQTFSG